LLLQGYIRRLAKVAVANRNVYDKTLWDCLARITTKKYEKGWSWIVREVAEGKNVQEVLDMAGGWWCE
jgi:hypothetical protein